MRSFYARVERKLLWASILSIYLPLRTSLIMIRQHRGMKRPGPTLHVRLRETGSTDRHALDA